MSGAVAPAALQRLLRVRSWRPLRFTKKSPNKNVCNLFEPLWWLWWLWWLLWLWLWVVVCCCLYVCGVFFVFEKSVCVCVLCVWCLVFGVVFWCVCVTIHFSSGCANFRDNFTPRHAAFGHARVEGTTKKEGSKAVRG